MKYKLHLSRAAIVLAVIIAATHSIALGFGLLALLALVLAPRTANVFRVTLSVPELSQLVIESFKVQTPELFGDGGFALDVSSDTAMLGDTITSHIGSVPQVADYDQTTGFANGATNAEDLLTDIPVTLNFFKHVPIRVKWLSQLNSKIDLSVALEAQGYALRKLIIDTALGFILPNNFTYQKSVDPNNASLDTLEEIRGKLNTQKAAAVGRFGIVNSKLAESIQSDQRVSSNLFYGQRAGDRAYRQWKNIAGFANVFEYPEFPVTGNLQGYFGDRRGIVVSVRPLDIVKVTPEDLGIPRLMSFEQMIDPQTKLPFTGVSWQQPGTGDLYISVGMLFGVTAGSESGAKDSLTDRAGVRVVTQGMDV